MSAKWSISNLPALAAICLLLLWCSPLSAQERDTVIIVKHDTVYLQRKPDTVVTGRTRKAGSRQNPLPAVCTSTPCSAMNSG